MYYKLIHGCVTHAWLRTELSFVELSDNHSAQTRRSVSESSKKVIFYGAVTDSGATQRYLPQAKDAG